MTVEGPAQHAHAFLHCNLNTLDMEACSAYYEALDLGTRMRSVSEDSDSTVMGLGPSTSSDVNFLYDKRGPRATPSLEVASWIRPATVPYDGHVDGGGLGFNVLGLRVADLDAAPLVAGAERSQSWVRGHLRPSARAVDPDGVTVELVQIEPAEDDPDATLMSHIHLSCSNLATTVQWYESIGFSQPLGAELREGGASLILAEDPTFSIEVTERPEGGPVPPSANTQGLYRIALAVDDVAAAHAAVLAAGYDAPDPVYFPMPDVPTGGFTVLFLADPDGIVVELVSRPRSAVRRPLQPA